MRAWRYAQQLVGASWDGYTYYLDDGNQVVIEYSPFGNANQSVAYQSGPTGAMFYNFWKNATQFTGIGMYLFDPQGSMVQRVSSANNLLTAVAFPFDYWLGDALGN